MLIQLAKIPRCCLGRVVLALESSSRPCPATHHLHPSLLRSSSTEENIGEMTHTILFSTSRNNPLKKAVNSTKTPSVLSFQPAIAEGRYFIQGKNSTRWFPWYVAYPICWPISSTFVTTGLSKDRVGGMSYTADRIADVAPLQASVNKAKGIIRRRRIGLTDKLPVSTFSNLEAMLQWRL